jgi:hypothetical protein
MMTTSWLGFSLLANDMDVPAEVAIAAIKAYQDAPSAKNYEAMTAAVEPARLQLIPPVEPNA